MSGPAIFFTTNPIGRFVCVEDQDCYTCTSILGEFGLAYAMREWIHPDAVLSRPDGVWRCPWCVSSFAIDPRDDGGIVEWNERAR